jgi:hypothetical protein
MADLRQVKPSISAAAREMYIYGRINPEKRFLARRPRRLATTSAGTTDCGAPPASFAIALPTPKNSGKFPEFFATRNATRSSVGMNTIHFARAVIHKRPLVRMLRTPLQKFPPAAAHLSEFFKICAEAHLPDLDGQARLPEAPPRTAVVYSPQRVRLPPASLLIRDGSSCRACSPVSPQAATFESMAFVMRAGSVDSCHPPPPTPPLLGVPTPVPTEPIESVTALKRRMQV